MGLSENRFEAACIQLRAGRDVDRNIEEADFWIRKAAAAGAQYVQTPEMTSLLETGRKRLFAKIFEQSSDPALRHFRALAGDLNIWLHIGSLAIRLDDTMAVNRGFLIKPSGTIAATYDKIHMFDVDLDHGETYRESRVYRAGEKSVVADLPWGRLGLAICYDVRFAGLYRDQALAGATVLTAPSAFTRQTGVAHWHVLIRARAIENGAFVVAAAQAGQHEDGRETFGHSMIVDPWGAILAEAGDEPGFVVANIDPQASLLARRRLPSLTGSRDYVPAAHGAVAQLRSVS